MPIGKHEADRNSSSTRASDQIPVSHQPSAAADICEVQVVLAPDVAFGRVTATLLVRQNPSEGRLETGTEQLLPTKVQHPEHESQAGSPDSPEQPTQGRGQDISSTAVSGMVQEQEAGEQVLRELREGVVALTERAACLDAHEGMADNEPEVSKVCCPFPTRSHALNGASGAGTCSIAVFRSCDDCCSVLQTAVIDLLLQK